MASDPCTLPNLIIAGVHKAGTTSLFSYLGRHRRICPSYTKEIGFFTPLLSGRDLPPLQEYGRHFGHCSDEPFRLEASPSYLYGKERVAARIRAELGDVRIIVILRDPADRLVSYFSRAISKQTLPAELSLEDYVRQSQQHLSSDERSVYARGLREGMYIDYLPPWQKVFGDNLKIVFFDDLERNVTALLTDICNWLGLDYAEFTASNFSIENKTLQYRNRGLHQRVRDFYIRHETFWRRHHQLKQGLRGLYNRFNADARRRPDTVDSTTISQLRSFYAPYNVRLGEFLETNGYPRTPAWLCRRTRT